MYFGPQIIYHLLESEPNVVVAETGYVRKHIKRQVTVESGQFDLAFARHVRQV